MQSAKDVLEIPSHEEKKWTEHLEAKHPLDHPFYFFVSNVKLSVGDNILGGWEYVMEVFVVLLSVNIPLDTHNFKVCNMGGHGLHLSELWLEVLVLCSTTSVEM
jgi:hypothetical protein